MQGRNGLASIRKSKDRCSRNEVIREEVMAKVKEPMVQAP